MSANLLAHLRSKQLFELLENWLHVPEIKEKRQEVARSRLTTAFHVRSDAAVILVESFRTSWKRAGDAECIPKSHAEISLVDRRNRTATLEQFGNVNQVYQVSYQVYWAVTKRSLSQLRRSERLLGTFISTWHGYQILLVTDKWWANGAKGKHKLPRSARSRTLRGTLGRL